MVRHSRKGFTLVELLVVLAIIAVLMSILLPALTKARAMSQTVKCMGNLRSIGTAFLTYGTDNDGYVVPGWIVGSGGGSGVENYATMLVGLKYLPAPDQGSMNADDNTKPIDSVFRCPSGNDIKHDRPTDRWPKSPNDPFASRLWRRQSVPGNAGWLKTGLVIDTSYCANMLDKVAITDDAKIFPMREVQRLTTGVVNGEFAKFSMFKNPGSLALLFDGVRYLEGDFNRISARHGTSRSNDEKIGRGESYGSTNYLFADGHCENLDVRYLPDLTPAQVNGTDLTVFKPWPHPTWRIDQ